MSELTLEDEAVVAEAAKEEEEAKPQFDLTKLPPELLSVIAKNLSDVLLPKHLCHLLYTSKGMQNELRQYADTLRTEHEDVRGLFFKCSYKYDRCVPERLKGGLHWGCKRRASPQSTNGVWNDDVSYKSYNIPPRDSNPDMVLLCKMLKSDIMINLHILDLSTNDLGDAVMNAITGAMDYRCLLRLTDLDLQKNQITTNGFKSFASSIATHRMKMLKNLNLINNPIGDGGIIALANALNKSALPSLTSLQVSGNKIGDDGLKALMGAASNKKLLVLETLNINYNEYGTEGFEALTETIEEDHMECLDKLYLKMHIKQLIRLSQAGLHKRFMDACENNGVRQWVGTHN